MIEKAVPNSQIHLSAKDVYKKFSLEAGLFTKYGQYVYALNGVSLEVEKGEIYGLVGESGSGKTTLAKSFVKLHKPDAGNFQFNSKNGEIIRINESSRDDLKKVRRQIKYVFQDPSGSMDPRMTVKEILLSGLKYSGQYQGKKISHELIIEYLIHTGLDISALERRTTDFSGGQRQRIALARALLCKPEILICDEVVSALDVSVRTQILNLLADLKQTYGLTLLFISHDLGVVSYLCDRVGVLYAGRMVEEGLSKEIFKEPLHPYTKLLYLSVSNGSHELTGYNMNEKPDLSKLLSCCPFANRCPFVMKRCKEEIPELFEISPKRKVACFLFNN